MALISTEPIKITPKSKSFVLNLTPCINNTTGYYALPTTIKLHEKNYDFDPNEFDYSAKAYFEYLTKGTRHREGISSKNVLKYILEERLVFYFDYQDTAYEPKRMISDINKKYGTSIRETNTWTYDIAASIISGLDSANIDITDFIIDEYVLTENTKHRINKKEEESLKEILRRYDSNISFDWVNFKMKYRLYNGLLLKNQIKYEINTQIIRKWNVASNTAQKDSANNYVTSDILLNISVFYFANYRDFSTEIESVCTYQSEIAATGILFTFDRASLRFRKNHLVNVSEQSTQIKYTYYPLFKIKNIDKAPEKYYYYGKSEDYDSLLVNFTGLEIENAIFKIPFNNTQLTTIGRNIIMNNFLISGIMDIKTEPIEHSNNKINIICNDIIVPMEIKEIEEHFKSIGLPDVKIEINNNFIRVFFKKTVL